ncbi:MAG: GNAT family N-acetyltransferase [Gammaproteobacteria bacterium]|jgi:uncharacterized protein YjbI with pentapeptide repeats/RimJ/RimL family protein N-acetyltransferase
MTIEFKKFSEEDVPVFYNWAEKPHVKNTWFQEVYEKKEAILEKIKGNSYDYPFLILIDDKPIGYIQCEDLTTFFKENPDCKNKYYFNEPKGTYCIDLFIGEKDYLGKGHGTKIIKQFSNWLLTKPEVKKLVIDPSTSNKKAIHCYEKAGFKYVRTAKDNVDEYHIMERAHISEIHLNDDLPKEYFNKTFKEMDLAQKTVPEKIFEKCKFIKCNFNETNFQKCRFCDCEFISSNLSVIKIKGCTFSEAVFDNSKVIGINWAEATWPKIKLACTIGFFKCDISHSTFPGLNLREINIVECRAHDVDFREADLTCANLTYSDFENSMFIESNLTEADFTFAENYRIDVNFNKIKGAKFMLPEAVSLLQGLDIELVDSN